MTKGLSFVQEGADVRTAIDSQKVVDTRFRYFNILQEVIISGGNLSGTNVVLYTHNLGYVPTFTLYNITQDTYMRGTSEFKGAWADKEYIYHTYEGDDYSGTKMLLRIFDVNITDEYRAPIVETLVSGKSRISNNGAKFAVKNGNLRSRELSDYTLNTQGKALALHKTGIVTGSGLNGEATVTHNIGYPPTFLATYVTIQRDKIAALNPSVITVLAHATATTLTFRGAQAVLDATLAYIIFKELGDFAI